MLIFSYRLLLLAIPSSVNCLPRKNGKALITRACYSWLKPRRSEITRTYCSMDLYFWYDSAFGAPLAKVLGIGYVQELVSRLTHTRIETHNTSTNATLDDSDVTFPLDQSLYVDATHEVVVLHGEMNWHGGISHGCSFYLLDLVITALNLTTLAANGPLPADHIPPNHSFKASHLAPFATNIQFQCMYRVIVTCTSDRVSLTL